MPTRMIIPLLMALSPLTAFVVAQSPLDEDLLNMAGKGQTALVEVLLELGADVHAKDENGQTALMIATAEGHPETVAALLDAGADVNVEDKNGGTALMIAERNGHTEMVELLGIDPQERKVWEDSTVAGTQAYQQGRYGEAETSWLAALEQAKKFGEDNTRLATSLNNLGNSTRSTAGKATMPRPSRS